MERQLSLTGWMLLYCSNVRVFFFDNEKCEQSEHVVLVLKSLDRKYYYRGKQESHVTTHSVPPS